MFWFIQFITKSFPMCWRSSSLIFLSLLVWLKPIACIQVDLPVGSVLGKQEVTKEGNTFYSFKGISYAEAPVGNLRFQAPVEKKSWKGILNATEDGVYCYQMGKDNSNANEDCLSINVFTPVAPSLNSSLPVMFFIHGGGFVNGHASSSWYGGHHFIDKGVILITIQYRLGPFGFLSFGDKIVPGNNGLKDQLLALQWTNKYIKYFGGDPEKVTIFGQSAGSASVTFHLLSAKSKGLFRAAICESGTALSPWSFQRQQPYVSRRLAEMINETEYNQHNTSSVNLLAYLQSLPADVVAATADREIPEMSLPRYIDIVDGFYFTPTIEPEHEGAFLTQKMYGLFEQGIFNRVPTVLGFNSLEMGFLKTSSTFENISKAYKEDINLLVPLDMKVKSKDIKSAAAEIYNFYNQAGDFQINDTKLLQYFSDDCFVRSILKQANFLSKYTDTYVYQFSYKGTLSGSPVSFAGFSNDVGHSEELFYLFSGIYNQEDASNWPQLNEMDRTTGRRMITLWTNFAKYRNPTPDKVDIFQNLTWPKYDHSLNYLDIGSWLEIRNQPKVDQLKMWERVYKKWGTPPFDSY